MPNKKEPLAKLNLDLTIPPDLRSRDIPITIIGKDEEEKAYSLRTDPIEITQITPVIYQINFHTG